jgi:hypothetical protein
MVTSGEPVEAGSTATDCSIEIEVSGYRLRVGAGVKASALRLVLDVLERR